MEAKELRIGNWISMVEDPVKYKDFHQVTLLKENFIEVHHGLVGSENYYPHPLTPEILEKCGYQKYGSYPMYKKRKPKKEGYHLQYEELSINDVNEDGKEFMTMMNAQCIALKYLHQLQNLFFALTNEELTVNLSEPASLSA